MQRRGPDRSIPMVVVGLGNPGAEYQGTRHNIGFSVVDQLQHRLRRAEAGSATGAQLISGHWKWRKVHLLKPLRYMNLSGEPVRLFLNSHDMSADQCLVVVDDLDLPAGTIRYRPGGSSGGQKGLEDIISALGTDRFARCRVGIGRPPAGVDTSDHVLEVPTGSGGEIHGKSVERATESVLCWLVEGVTSTARRYNGPLPEDQDRPVEGRDGGDGEE